MADLLINQLNDFTDSDGYIAVGTTAAGSTGGGKKLLSTITPDASQATPGQVLTVNDQNQAEWKDNNSVPPLPADASTCAYVLGIQNGELAWVKLQTEYIDSSYSGNAEIEYQ